MWEIFFCKDCLCSYPIEQIKINGGSYNSWLKTHTHLETICSLCWQVVRPLEAKDHSCPLKVYVRTSPYKKLACFDFETSANPQDPKGHEAIFISCFFETVKIGHFQRIDFVSDEVHFEGIDGVLSTADEYAGSFTYDYYPPKVAVHVPETCDLKMSSPYINVQ